MKRSILALLAMLSLASAIQAAESTPPGNKPSATDLDPSWAILPDSLGITVTPDGQPPRRTTLGALRASYAKAFDEGVKVGVAETADERARDGIRIEFLEDDLERAAKGEGDAIALVKRYQDGIVVGVVAGSVVVAGIYVFGVWTGLQLQAAIP